MFAAASNRRVGAHGRDERAYDTRNRLARLLFDPKFSRDGSESIVLRFDCYPGFIHLLGCLPMKVALHSPSYDLKAKFCIMLRHASKIFVTQTRHS